HEREDGGTGVYGDVDVLGGKTDPDRPDPGEGEEGEPDGPGQPRGERGPDEDRREDDEEAHDDDRGVEQLVPRRASIVARDRTRAAEDPAVDRAQVRDVVPGQAVRRAVADLGDSHRDDEQERSEDEQERAVVDGPVDARTVPLRNGVARRGGLFLGHERPGLVLASVPLVGGVTGPLQAGSVAVARGASARWNVDHVPTTALGTLIVRHPNSVLGYRSLL